VLSAVCLTILAPIPAGLGLLFQAVSHYIVVPSHVLAAIVFVGVGMLLTVLILALLVYLVMRKHPLLIFGALFGAAMFGGFHKRVSDHLAKHAAPAEPKAPSQPKPGRAADSPTPRELRDMFDRVRASE
jgi:hypothetical protein